MEGRDLSPALEISCPKDSILQTHPEFLDAQILARFGAVIQPPARSLPDRETRNLRDLVATIAQQRTWRHRAGTHGQELAQRHLTWLQAELAQVDRQLQRQRQGPSRPGSSRMPCCRACRVWVRS